MHIVLEPKRNLQRRFTFQWDKITFEVKSVKAHDDIKWIKADPYWTDLEDLRQRIAEKVNGS